MFLVETQDGKCKINIENIRRFYIKKNKIYADVVGHDEPYVLGSYKNKDRAFEVYQTIKDIAIFKMPEE